MATPSPPINNSPTTPDGHNVLNGLTTKTSQLAIGLPIGILEISFCISPFTSYMVAHTVVSVGPYALRTGIFNPNLLCHLRTDSAGKVSPPTNKRFTEFNLSNISFGISAINLKNAVGKTTFVIPFF